MALGLLLLLGLGLLLLPPGAWQHNFRAEKHTKLMVTPYASAEMSDEDSVSAAGLASQTTPSRPEAAAEEESLGHLLAALQHAMRGAQRSAGTAAPSPTTTAPCLEACRRRAEKQKGAGRGTVTRKPALSAVPSLLPQPGISVSLCGFESPQLAAAMAELASAFQTAGAKRENDILDQLKNGFNDIFKECF